MPTQLLGVLAICQSCGQWYFHDALEIGGNRFPIPEPLGENPFPQPAHQRFRRFHL